MLSGRRRGGRRPHGPPGRPAQHRGRGGPRTRPSGTASSLATCAVAAATMLAGLEVGSLFEQQKVFQVTVWSTPDSRGEPDRDQEPRDRHPERRPCPPRGRRRRPHRADADGDPARRGVTPDRHRRRRQRARSRARSRPTSPTGSRPRSLPARVPRRGRSATTRAPTRCTGGCSAPASPPRSASCSCSRRRSRAGGWPGSCSSRFPSRCPGGVAGGVPRPGRDVARGARGAPGGAGDRRARDHRPDRALPGARARTGVKPGVGLVVRGAERAPGRHDRDPGDRHRRRALAPDRHGHDRRAGDRPSHRRHRPRRPRHLDAGRRLPDPRCLPVHDRTGGRTMQRRNLTALLLLLVVVGAARRRPADTPPPPRGRATSRPRSRRSRTRT